MRHMWLAAALFLLSLRLLSPAGFMPEWSGDAFHLRLCDGVSARATPQHHGGHGAAGHHGGSESHDEAQPPCPYAVAAGHGFDVPPLAPFAGPAEVIEAGIVAPSRSAPRVERRLERPRSRGPPTIA